MDHNSSAESKELIHRSRRVCFFAHYHQHGIVADHVLYYLRAIRDSGFAIIVVSTADLAPEEERKLRNTCDHFIPRKNEGLDFGSWIEAFRHFPRLEADLLLLTNDSVYGPISDLSRFIDDLTSSPADFYGAVECNIIQPHLQSWFLLFRPSAYTSQTFRDRFSEPIPSHLSKEDIIRRYEIGLTASLREAGLRYRSGFRAGDRGLLWSRFPGNPTHLLWRQLIEIGDIPFLKIDLLQRNPHWIGNLAKWRSVVGAHNPLLLRMIEADILTRGEAKVQSFPTRVCRSLKSPFPEDWAELHGFLRRDYELAGGRRFRLGLNAILFRAVQISSRYSRKLIGAALKLKHSLRTASEPSP